jgi:hypothetical protein
LLLSRGDSGRAFNLTNKPNYSQIGRIVNASDYGMIDSEISPRQLQFGGKVTFW